MRNLSKSNNEELIDLNSKSPDYKKLLSTDFDSEYKPKYKLLSKSLLIILSIILMSLITFLVVLIIYKKSSIFKTQFKKVNKLGTVKCKCIDMKYSYDNKYIICLEEHNGLTDDGEPYTNYTFHLIDSNTYEQYNIPMPAIQTYQYTINLYEPLPNNTLIISETFFNYNIREYMHTVSEFTYNKYNIIKQKEIHKSNYTGIDGIKSKSLLYMSNVNHLIVNMDKPNSFRNCSSKYLYIYNCNDYSIIKKIEYKDTYVLNIINKYNKYIHIDIKQEFYKSPYESKFTYRYSNTILDSENDYSISKEFYRDNSTDNNFKGFFINDYNINNNHIFLVKNNDIYNIYKPINIDDINNLDYIQDNRFVRFPLEYTSLIEIIYYDLNATIFADKKGDLNMYEYDSKNFRLVYLEYFDKKANTNKINYIKSLNGHIFGIGFTDNTITFYKF